MMPSRSIPRRSSIAALLLLAMVPYQDVTPVRDLEVGVPPGSPTTWARWIPVLTPRREPLFPRTGPRTDNDRDRTRTVASMPRVRVDAQIGGAGVLRITTADVTGHLTWVSGPPKPAGPITGTAGRALPAASATLQWIGTAAFLRLLLHRQQVSAAELQAHLVELGEPALWSVDAAAAERALQPIADDVRGRIERTGHGSALPVGSNPREAMLLRFVTDELALAHPYDPEGAFGRRLFVFAAEIEPLLIRFLRTDAEPFLLRNATAALGRYRSGTAQAALVEAAASTTDMVVLMRALAALEPGCRAQPLLDRLERSTDAVETAALVAALGRIRAAEALPKLVALAHRGLRHDPDLLMTVLAALCRVPVGAAERALPALASTVWQAARTTPGRFLVELPQAGPQPDFPDNSSLRGEILEQLALLLRIGAGDDARARDALLDVLKDAHASRKGAAFVNQSIGPIWPPAQIPLVETLPRLGPAGLLVLAAMIDDDTCDPVLRVAALAQLPASTRDPIADRLLAAADPDLPSELRLAAVQVLDTDAVPEVVERCQELLRAAARRPPGAATPAQRSLWLAALQALDRRAALRASDLVPLLAHVLAAPARRSGSAAALRVDVADLAAALVQDIADGLEGKQIQARVEALVDRVIAARTDARFTNRTRAATAKYVRGLLAGVSKRRRDAAYHAMVARSITDYFVPDQSLSLLTGAREIEAVVPFEEAILLALGHTGSPEAVQAIKTLLAQEDLECRAHVCLAAGATGDRSLAPPLVQALLDDDGFVRFCAYEALRQLTGKDIWADWMYGDAAGRGAAAQMWFRYCNRSGK